MKDVGGCVLSARCLDALPKALWFDRACGRGVTLVRPFELTAILVKDRKCLIQGRDMERARTLPDLVGMKSQSSLQEPIERMRFMNAFLVRFVHVTAASRKVRLLQLIPCFTESHGR